MSTTAENVTGAIKDIFSVGLSAYADSQLARRYQVNDPVYGSAANATGYGLAGQPQYVATNVPIWVWIGVGVAAFALLRR
jgi:hypothetical protein